MRVFIIAVLALVAGCHGATTPARPMGQGSTAAQAAVNSASPTAAEAITTDAGNTPPGVTDITTDMPVTFTTDGVDSGTSTTGTQGPVVITTTSAPQALCNPVMTKIAAIYNYTNEDSFKNLSENQQILIYELLAAAENCALKDFLTPSTAQRIFLVTEDLPLRQVYSFISFLARNLEAEGIVVPV